jgi:cystathionine beta-lyase
MTYDFDQYIDRFDTHCIKWEFTPQGDSLVQSDRAHPKYGPDQLLPLWVADMDFKSPPPVIDALEARARHGIFGYCMPDNDFYEAVTGWMDRHYGRSIDRDWIVITPGVVTALKVFVQTFTEPGDKVLLQPPVYHPFYHAIEQNGRVVERSPLKLNGLHYEMDFEDLARKTADPAVKMAFLCSPHNPIGRVWTPEELKRYGDICRENGVLVIADEIHCDLILNGNTFTSYAGVDEKFAAESIVCTAPSKTFNLAGLHLSNIIVQDDELRRRMQKTMTRNGIGGLNPFGLVATVAAYRYGEPWLADLLQYIEGNFQFLQEYLAEHLPQLEVVPLEGTYLAWVNFGALGLGPSERAKLLMDEAKVWLNSGAIFGPEGADFERINIACPRDILEEALDRIRRVVG